MELRNKSILIISPNYWGKMMVSKHHYALELAKRGNTVYFLNPPNLKKKYFETRQIQDRLFLIDYKPIFRGKKYLPSFLFNLLINLQVRFLISKINKPIDIVWSFDSSIYLDLNYFKPTLKIYFIADNAPNSHKTKISKTADLIISVAENLIEDLPQFNKKQLIVNHGLSEYFISNRNVNQAENTQNVRLAFVGNLFKKALDRKIFRQLINENPLVAFHLYGAFRMAESNLSGYQSTEATEFIEFLEHKENVHLEGVIGPEELVGELKDYQLFLFIENPQEDINNSSNSHKLIEYLSIGKVLVSSHVHAYENKRELIEMVDEMHNEHLPALFKKVIHNLEYYNSPELQQKRIEYALDNTYEKQIKRIEERINQLKGKKNFR